MSALDQVMAGPESMLKNTYDAVWNYKAVMNDEFLALISVAAWQFTLGQVGVISRPRSVLV